MHLNGYGVKPSALAGSLAIFFVVTRAERDQRSVVTDHDGLTASGAHVPFVGHWPRTKRVRYGYLTELLTTIGDHWPPAFRSCSWIALAAYTTPKVASSQRWRISRVGSESPVCQKSL